MIGAEGKEGVKHGDELSSTAWCIMLPRWMGFDFVVCMGVRSAGHWATPIQNNVNVVLPRFRCISSCAPPVKCLVCEIVYGISPGVLQDGCA
jgi:hypothetical protein